MSKIERNATRRSKRHWTDSPRVLLLEDDEDFRNLLGDFLTNHEYEVIGVGSGAEGIREVLGGEFSLVICDMVMPKTSGSMFYRAVERIRPDLCDRFIFMTGYSLDPIVEDFIRSIRGVVLGKPFPFAYLLEVMTERQLTAGVL